MSYEDDEIEAMKQEGLDVDDTQCPWGGCQEIQSLHMGEWGGTVHYWVQCDGGGQEGHTIEGPSKQTPKEAIKAWMERA